MVEPSPAVAVASPLRELLRSVNEHVTRFGDALSVREEFDYVCECTDVHCAVPVRLALSEYTRIAETPGWYVVAPGHIRPEEHVVERGRAYVVVTRRAA